MGFGGELGVIEWLRRDNLRTGSSQMEQRATDRPVGPPHCHVHGAFEAKTSDRHGPIDLELVIPAIYRLGEQHLARPY